MTRPGDPSLHPDEGLDITPEGEKGWLVEARAVVSDESYALFLAHVLTIYGMYAKVKAVGGDEGEG